uniref:Uncharacterized protein n=1 Tax=Candidatus Kentrum sp. SD TaxID=2126332 RepID=A0A451BHF6_9GAMM|nr:MAG: hypothetical protein BECKSD772D_GA0070982_100164 [Candidatus Kentron sp. SD]
MESGEAPIGNRQWRRGTNRQDRCRRLVRWGAYSFFGRRRCFAPRLTGGEWVPGFGDGTSIRTLRVRLCSLLVSASRQVPIGVFLARAPVFSGFLFFRNMNMMPLQGKCRGQISESASTIINGGCAFAYLPPTSYWSPKFLLFRYVNILALRRQVRWGSCTCAGPQKSLFSRYTQDKA